MPDRVVVYVDAQNTYKGARDAFFPGRAHFTLGQIDPIKLGRLLIQRPVPGGDRELKQVRMYSGRPDARKQPKANRAHLLQCAAWESAGVYVLGRPLRYPRDFPQSKPQEKGVDVELAIDLVTHSISRHFDVAIVFSTDRDLRPALEWVARQSTTGPRVELTAWRSPTSNRRIPVDAPVDVRCHWLDRADYEAVHDPTDYTRAGRR